MHRGWAAAAAGWLGLIFLSSTSFVARWCEEVFHAILGDRYAAVPLPGTPEHWLHFLAQKSVHVTLFAVFAILLWKALPERRSKLALVFLIGGTTGICSELLQRLFPGRDPAVRDALINFGATVAGALAFRAWTRRSAKPVIIPVSGETL